MSGIGYLDTSSYLDVKERQMGSSARQALSVSEQSRFRAVGRENQRAAAIDCTDFKVPSSSWQGSFSFSFSAEMSTSISWQGGMPQVSTSASFEASFSFSFALSQQGYVELGEGIEASPDKITGKDFEFNSEGILKLFEELIERLKAEDRPELDLGGKLDDRALELLQQLGLLDEDGKATMLLQFLSDFAGLNRFQDGQQVGPERGTGGYGPRAYGQISLVNLADDAGGQARSAGRHNAGVDANTGGNIINGAQAGRDIRIDDRDVININVNNQYFDE